jgi:hypothetical protein
VSAVRFGLAATESRLRWTAREACAAGRLVVSCVAHAGALARMGVEAGAVVSVAMGSGRFLRSRHVSSSRSITTISRESSGSHRA